MTKTFTIAVTGQSLIKHDTRDVKTAGFGNVEQILRRADFAFTNFESTILGSHGGWPLKGGVFGCSQPHVLDALQAIGFQGLSLSNNHAFDLGPAGILSTLEEVEKRSLLHAGIGRNHTDATRAAKGTFGDKKVALVAMDGGPGPDFMYAADATTDRPERPGINRLKLSKIVDVDADTFERLQILRDRVDYTSMDLANDSQPDDAPHVDQDTEVCIARAVFRRADRFGRNVKIDEQDLSRNLATIRSAADEGALVIAYLHHHHWAPVWAQVPDWVGAVARACIDAGAAMFVSHGAPVLQPVEIYRGRPIFYSLGNFIFHVKSAGSRWGAPEVWESVIGLCSFGDDGQLVEMTFHPVIIGGAEAMAGNPLEDRLVPEVAQGAHADKILRRFQEHSRSVGTKIEVTDGIGYLRI